MLQAWLWQVKDNTIACDSDPNISRKEMCKDGTFFYVFIHLKKPGFNPQSCILKKQ